MKSITLTVLLAVTALKSLAATQYATPPRGNFRVAYEESKWIPERIRDREENTFRRALTHESGNVYCQVNTENFDFSNLDPVQTVIDRVKRSDPYAKIVVREKREINGIEGDYFEMRLEMRNQPFRFVFFVHSGKDGSIQFMVYMPDAVQDTYDLDIRELLNGIELKDKGA